MTAVFETRSLSDLLDAALTDPAHLDLLSYDVVSGKVRNRTIAQAGVAAASHAHALADVTGLVGTLSAKANLASPTFSGLVTADSFAGSGAGLTSIPISAVDTLNTRLSSLDASAATFDAHLANSTTAHGGISVDTSPSSIVRRSAAGGIEANSFTATGGVINLGFAGQVNISPGGTFVVSDGPVTGLYIDHGGSSISTDCAITAPTFAGSGEMLTSLPAEQLTGTVANARTTGTTAATASTLALRDSAGSIAAAQYLNSTQALTDGASIAWNLNNGVAAALTIGGNRTLSNPTNIKAGGTYILTVTQDGTGSRTLAYGTNYKWPGGIAPLLSTAVGAKDVLTFFSPDGTLLYGAIQKGFA